MMQFGIPCSADAEFERWWRADGEWVEAPNVRRGGNSGVQRVTDASGRCLYVKRQTGHLYRTVRHPFGRPTVLREATALQALSALDIPVPVLDYCGARRDTGQWAAVLVTRALDGHQSLDRWYAEPRDEALRKTVLDELARLLARMHRAHWQHGCLYAKHIFVRERPQAELPNVALLDLEKARLRLSASRASKHDLAQLSRHRAPMPDQDWRTFLASYQAAHRKLGMRP
ncbi:hypothetical protein CGK74_14080 [Thauera propionica]|uniref:InaA protein n=1 Tax=Thauera propionica TaxID=2019431 RepID=A0A235EWF5_9RHOO|nr:lipopolysaccharide kinase InaA family protein [Thauera propionica]OYD53331.1 hypothetical protein CGK74_14080 [Thauera propionica]